MAKGKLRSYNTAPETTATMHEIVVQAKWKYPADMCDVAILVAELAQAGKTYFADIQFAEKFDPFAKEYWDDDEPLVVEHARR